MAYDDFSLLARFCHALANLTDFNGIPLYWELGEVEMTLPVWSLADSGWTLAKYKLFTHEAIGLEMAAFRRLCRYLRVHEHVLIDLLFRLSMLAVAPGQTMTGPRRFRQGFHGRRKGTWYADNAAGFGLVIERRRAEDGFGGILEVRHVG